MIDDINFLPADYHRTRDRRRNKIWRRGVCAVFLLLIVAGGAKQWHSCRNLEATRDKLRRRAAETLARLGPVEPLEARIAQLGARGELLTRLRRRIPPTRLIADVTQSLPEFVSLTQFRVQRERIAQPAGRAKAAPADPAAVEKLTPTEADLAALDRLAAESNVVVSLAGIAPDDVSISHFLAALQETGTFAEVQLQYTDETTFREHRLRSFSMRLVARRPGSDVLRSTRVSLEMRNQP